MSLILFNCWCPSAGSLKPQSETYFEQSTPPREDRHLNGGYWVQHSLIHNLTGLPNRAHSCSRFDRRSHLASRRCGQLEALYCQDEKADVGPVDRVACRHTATNGVVTHSSGLSDLHFNYTSLIIKLNHHNVVTLTLTYVYVCSHNRTICSDSSVIV